MFRGKLLQRRTLSAANIHTFGAAVGEGTAGRHVQRAGRFALDGLDLFAEIHLRVKNGVQQRFGIGMAADVGHALAGHDLHDVAEVHDGDLVGEGLYEPQIVADEAYGDNSHAPAPIVLIHFNLFVFDLFG